MLPVGLIEPRERLLLVSETQVCINERAGRDISGLSASLQLCQYSKSIGASAGVGVSPNQDAEHPLTAMGNGSGLLKRSDRLLGVAVGDEHEAQIPERGRVVGVNAQAAAEFPDGIIVPARLERFSRSAALRQSVRKSLRALVAR